MEKIKTEGEKVAKGESVFRYYTKNEETLKTKISELDTKIQDVMASETGIYSSDIKIIENQIDKKITELKNTTDVTKLEEDKKEIEELVTKKAKIAGDLSPKGSYLSQLITERSKYENELNSGAEYVKAPESGIASYRVDGFEDKLTPNNFSEISKDYLESLDLKTGKIVATSDESGKIINNFSCYIVTISNSKEAQSAKVGDNIKIRVLNNLEMSGKIRGLTKQANDNILIVIEFDKNIAELASYRKISFDLIWWKYTGLKVPNQAIVEQNGLNYLVRTRTGYLNKMLIKLEAQNDDYSIITTYTTEELKNMGFTQTQINSNKKISLYDEVLLNPDLSKAE